MLTCNISGKDDDSADSSKSQAESLTEQVNNLLQSSSGDKSKPGPCVPVAFPNFGRKGVEVSRHKGDDTSASALLVETAQFCT